MKKTVLTILCSEASVFWQLRDVITSIHHDRVHVQKERNQKIVSLITYMVQLFIGL